MVRSRGSRNTPLTDSDIDVDKKEMDPVKAKHNKLKRLMIEMQSAHKRVHELQNTVELKVKQLLRIFYDYFASALLPFFLSA